MLLKNKNIIVTGGSRGLGRSLCITFAKEGANVAFNFSEDEHSATGTQQEAAAYGTKVQAFKASVLDKETLTLMINTVEESWGSIDILVNNAGISQMLPMALLEEEDWDMIMDTNVKGFYLITRLVLRGMIRRRQGTILNIGSVAGLRLLEAPVHYSASKAAIKGFTESLAKEVGRYGIRVNMLAPGILEGGVGSNLPSYRLEEYIKNCALKRIGTFDEVSEMAAFLISEQNSYMNGATLTMDGGL